MIPAHFDGLSWLTPLLQGLTLGLGLIAAIGPQNVFVLRQGLRREHIGNIVLFCVLTDAILISAGVLGMAQALNNRPALAQVLALGGVVFLLYYGLQALRRVRSPQHLQAAHGQAGMSRGAALAQAAAFTLLNPHVYLDTVVLMGSIGAQHPTALQWWFIAGASAASAIWFVGLGLGARWLSPWFAKPRAWQVLDALIGLTMWTLAALLALHVWGRSASLA